MSPDEFLRSVAARAPEPVYLFLGPEAWDRDRCRAALIHAVLPPEDREEGMIRHDLDDTTLAAALDDAQSFSLFARNRLIWISGAEAVLPRGRAVDEDSGAAAALAAYVKNPAPATTVVLDCSRYELEGDDKVRADRVRKFYSSVRSVVEFERYTPEAARRLAAQLVKERKLRIGSDELQLLVDVLAADAGRIAAEIEKLSLYAGTERAVTEQDIWNLTPNSRASTIFALVAAIGRRDRAASLESLDVLVREGEYLALALSFLATQFRQALVAKEAKLSGWSQVQAYFARSGMQLWRSRAEQVAQTAAAFSAPRLREAIVSIFETDRALRDMRPDDRIVMEKFILDLTG